MVSAVQGIKNEQDIVLAHSGKYTIGRNKHVIQYKTDLINAIQTVIKELSGERLTLTLRSLAGGKYKNFCSNFILLVLFSKVCFL